MNLNNGTTVEEERPDPEALLAAFNQEERKLKGGKLKIFFGMSAGVGKTYAMLEEAQKRSREGVDVVIGTVNTHGRVDTAKLLDGLPVVPEKWIKYKDAVFEECDIDEILKRKPQLVLIDELAHTNVPGSRHLKRWQDVLEILDAGIDVYSTLNVQHVESLKDVVERITGVQIRETVPDLILERATQIELVDIPPVELLQRLKEGKVYLGDQSLLAAQNFFKEDRLTALREIALRFTAEKVDHDLHGMISQTMPLGWKTRERLLVAVGPSPHSQQIIRAARRLAFELDAPWIAVYVDTGVILSDEDQARLGNNLNLARDLGAEVMTTVDADVVTALQKIVRQRNVSQILIGRPSTHPIWDLFKENMIERLVKESVNVDIIVVRQDSTPYVYQRVFQPYRLVSSKMAYGLSFLLCFAMALLGHIWVPEVGYKTIGFGFLFAIFILSLFVGRGPIIFAGILSATFWYLLFIPEEMSDAEDIAILSIYVLSTVVIGTLISQIKAKETLLSLAEEKSGALYEIEKKIANAVTFEQMRSGVRMYLRGLFPGDFDILAAKEDGSLEEDSLLPILKQEKERAVALWVFKNGKIAGWSTDTLPSVQGLYFPIKGLRGSLGVLAYQPRTGRVFSMSEMNFLQTVIQQIALFLQKLLDEERAKLAAFTTQVEKIHDAIFQSFSHVFRAPIAKISKASQILQNEAVSDEERFKLRKQIEKAAYHLQRAVDNIMAMSKLTSGFIRFQKEPQDIRKLIRASLRAVEIFAEGRTIETSVPEDLPFVPFDFNLMELAVSNVLMNSIEYSPVGTPVYLNVSLEDKAVRITVVDEGPGIPLNILPLIFEKFYQVHVPGTHPEGIGLGLPVAKAIIELHGGTIKVQNKEKGGVESVLTLPVFI